jgi:ribulose 1,5-bisphosphate synthetase/thiazole synthase
MRYSFLQLLKQGLLGNTGWTSAWRTAELQRTYDAVIIGGDDHGLAAAYYLAKRHGVRRVAVLERGWLGGGNIIYWRGTSIRLHVERPLARFLLEWFRQAATAFA